MCHRNQGLGGESLSGFNPPLSVRLIKDITSPHKPSSAQEYWKGHFEWKADIHNAGSSRATFQIKPQTEDFSLPISKS